MNFMGMGMFEMAAIMIVGFLALGPTKSIEVAKTTGKLLGDLRRTFNEVLSAVDLEGEDSPRYRRPNTRPSQPTDDSLDDPSDDPFPGGKR